MSVSAQNLEQTRTCTCLFRIHAAFAAQHSETWQDSTSGEGTLGSEHVHRAHGKNSDGQCSRTYLEQFSYALPCPALPCPAMPRADPGARPRPTAPLHFLTARRHDMPIANASAQHHDRHGDALKVLAKARRSRPRTFSRSAGLSLHPSPPSPPPPSPPPSRGLRALHRTLARLLTRALLLSPGAQPL